MCNKDTNNPDGTSQYIGLDVGSGNTCKKFTTKFIFEKRSYSGTVAMIFNPNGITAGSQILAKSVHVVLTNTYVSVALLLNSQNAFYSAHNFASPLPLDGVTENTMTIEVSGNTISVTVNGNTYTDAVTGLDVSEFNGRYALFEFFCLGDRTIKAMPQYTYMKLEDDNSHVIEDDFQRPNGLLTVTPNGTPYSVYT